MADLEGGAWPLPGARFDAVVVTNYLWRALWPALLEALADGGVLIYETFADGNQSVGKPSRADFLLRHGELLEATHGLRIVAYEDGFLDGPPRFVQHIAAVRAADAGRRPGALSAFGRTMHGRVKSADCKENAHETHSWQHRRPGHADA